MNKYYDIVHVMDNMDTALTWKYMYVAVLVKCGKYYNVLIFCVKEDQNTVYMYDNALSLWSVVCRIALLLHLSSVQLCIYNSFLLKKR